METLIDFFNDYNINYLNINSFLIYITQKILKTRTIRCCTSFFKSIN